MLLYKQIANRCATIIFTNVFGVKTVKQPNKQHLDKAKQQLKKHPHKSHHYKVEHNQSRIKNQSEVFASLLHLQKLQDYHLSLLNSEMQTNRKVPQEIIILAQESLRHLTSISPQHFKPVIEICSKVGLRAVPQCVCQIFIKTHDEMNSKWEWMRQFDSTFLKKIAMRIVQNQGKKGDEELAAALRHLGELLSVNQIKKIDAHVTQKGQTLVLPLVVRFLSIFRQLKKIGEFVSYAQIKILKHKSELDLKLLINASISFLQIGKEQSFQVLQEQIANKINQKQAEAKDIVALSHIMHKFKTGGLKIWRSCQQFMKPTPPNLIFIFLAAQYRHLQTNEALFHSFLALDPSFQYIHKLQEKEWIEVMIVLYGNTWKLKQNSKAHDAFRQILNKRKMKGVYNEIQCFMRFLISKDQLRKENLKHSYPDDTLTILLSLQFQAEIGPCPSSYKQDYLQELSRRYPPQTLKSNLHLIVVEQFIRYKLMSMMKATGQNIGMQRFEEDIQD